MVQRLKCVVYAPRQLETIENMLKGFEHENANGVSSPLVVCFMDLHTSTYIRKETNGKHNIKRNANDVCFMCFLSPKKTHSFNNPTG